MSREEFQPWRKFKPADGEAHGWVQWKGTSVCMDFHCECGELGHLDAEFAYAVKCGACGALYEMSGFVEAHRVESVDHDAIVVAHVDGHGDDA